MRYRDTVGVADQPAAARAAEGQEVVLLTVWMTLVIGVLFTVVGVRAGQRWLVFWGGLTLVACGIYFTFTG